MKPNLLPLDPRTLLKTPTKITYYELSNGKYWHNGFANCLRNYFISIEESKLISININIDGLPIFKSSKEGFWPILFNIYEIPDFKPMCIGVFSGKGKPADLKEFLSPFVNEMNDILENGLIINGISISVSIRAFICDAPARAFVKGRVILTTKTSY